MGLGSLILVAGLAAVACEGAKILAFLPFPAKSHQAVFTPLVRELAARGHHVTAYVPYPLPNPPKTYKEVLLPDDLFKELHDQVDILEFGKMTALGQTVGLHEVGLFIQNKVLKLDTVQKLIKSDEKFDAVILESLFVQESFAVFQHKFNAIAIEILPLGSSAWLSYWAGSPYNPSYVLDFKTPFTDRMTFYERLHNAVVSYGTNLIGQLLYMPKTEELASKYFNYPGSESRPRVTELLSQKSLFIVNSHFSVGYPNPTTPNVIEVGGIHIRPSKPLPKDLQVFMDEAKDGAIYFSLGSNINVSDVTKAGVFTAFNNAFAKLKQKVLWKWEKDEFPNKPPNVKISKWFPQQDILAHKNCKLFITHGGFLSLAESVKFGVPMLGIPFFGDQPKNIRQAEAAGMGIQINLDDITETTVLKAINEIISNPSYAESAKLRAQMFNERPQSPLESAAYWVEWVIRHKGAPQLRPASTTLPWYQLHLIDVGAALLGAVLLVVTLFYLMVRKFLRLICGRTTKSPPEKKSKKKTN